MGRSNVCFNHSAFAKGCGYWIIEIPFWDMQGNKSLKLSIWIKKCSKGTKTTTTRYCACHRTLVCAYSQQNKNGSAVQKRQGDAATTNQSSTILSGNHFEIIHSPNPQLQAVFFFFVQMVLSVDHWETEHWANHTIVTGISIPDVGTQRLKWVLFALLTDTFLLKSERLRGLQEVTHNLRGVYAHAL